MRTLGLVPVLVGAAALAAAASAAPIPTPPVPTVTVPPLPVNPPPLPAPAPPVPPAPQLPPPPPVVTTPVSAPPAATSAVAQAAGGAVSTTAGSVTSGSSPGALAGGSGTGTGSGPAGSGGSAGSGSASSATASSSTAAGVDHFHSSRPWIGVTGSKRRQTTILTFVLRHRGRVVFMVNQVSPACTSVGRFVRPGHTGVNRVRFDGVVGGEQLTPGTYRISIRTAHGRVVRRVTLVVVDGSAPSRDELRALRLADTCVAGDASSGTTTGMPTFASDSASPSNSQKATATSLSGQDSGSAAGLMPPTPDVHTGVLATSIEKTARAIEPLLVALLAASILLLGLASLPREAMPGPRMHDTLARHRLELAALGATALVAVALAFLLT